MKNFIQLFHSNYTNYKSNISGEEFSPDSLSGLTLWLDADDAGTITKDGSNNVSQWVDKSGNSTTFVQPSGTLQPVWEPNIFDTKPGIAFNTALMDCSVLADRERIAQLQERTFFTVIRTDGDREANRFIFRAFNDYFWFGSGDNSNIRFENSSGNIESFISAGGAITDNTNSVLATTISSSNVKQTINGTTIHDVAYSNGFNPSPTTPTFVLLGCGNTAGTWEVDGYIAEIIYYDRALSSSEISEVEDYLKNKYGISY